jgi:hypothetical protein
LLSRTDRREAVLTVVDVQEVLTKQMNLRWTEKRGAMIPTTEIIAFELLKEAGTEEFRGLSKLLK